jgi:hypothetical protein
MQAHAHLLQDFTPQWGAAVFMYEFPGLCTLAAGVHSLLCSNKPDQAAAAAVATRAGCAFQSPQ